jgi:primosomal protein N'
MKCVSCERPLICADCGKVFEARSEGAFRTAHEPESPLVCPTCDEPLVCKWCGHSYAGDATEFDEE